MPRKYTRKIGSRKYMDYSAAKMDEALSELRSHTLTQRQAAIKYNIPRSTLKNKLKGAHPGDAGGPTVFSKEDEATFKSYIVTASEYGFPVDSFDLRCIVKGYADRKGITIRQFKKNMPGKEWITSFLKRHQDLTIRFASNIKRKRAEVGPTVIEEYFQNLSKELEGVDACNIWNYDETNLTDEPGQKKVVTKRGCKYPERIINSTKSCVSLMFCGNGEGELLPPYIVYKAESLWSTWMQDGPKNARYNRSRSGWFDHVCFEDWFFTLLLPRIKKGSGKHVIIGDNLSSHISIAVLEACQQNNIAFVSLPPNATHLAQPLDVAFFRPMKIAWRQIISEWKEKGKGRRLPSIPKDEFPRLLNSLMTKLKARGSENLKAGFRKTGIYPLDKTQILSRLPSADSNASGTTSELVSQSFVDHLRQARGDDEASCNARIKRRKVAVAPGKSLSAEEALEQLPVRATVFKKTDAGTTSRTGKRGADTNRTGPVSATSAADSDVSESDTEFFDETCSMDTSVGTNCSSPDSKFSDVEPTDTCTDVHPDISARKCVPLEIHKGDFVVVEYEGRLYPGEVKVVKKQGAEVSCMEKRGINWKWPLKPDQIYYQQSEITQVITAPKKISRRGLFSVPELADI